MGMAEIQRVIRVGIVGFQAGRSWSSVAHVPALESLAGSFKITGVANSSVKSSSRAAAILGLDKAFENAQQMAASPGIDLLVVTVKAPDHRAVVEAAFDHGKAVLCEWPLGIDLPEGRDLTNRAGAIGVPAW